MLSNRFFDYNFKVGLNLDSAKTCNIYNINKCNNCIAIMLILSAKFKQIRYHGIIINKPNSVHCRLPWFLTVSTKCHDSTLFLLSKVFPLDWIDDTELPYFFQLHFQRALGISTVTGYCPSEMLLEMTCAHGDWSLMEDRHCWILE